MSSSKTHRILLVCLIFCLFTALALLFLFPVFGVLYSLCLVIFWMVFFILHPDVWQSEKGHLLNQKKRAIRRMMGEDANIDGEHHLEDYELLCIKPTGVDHYPIKKETFLIGRSSSCDCSIPEVGTASKEHCRIIYRKYSQEFFVEDMHSSNGTYLGTRRLEPYTQEKLLENAELTIGTYSFRFVRR